MSSILFYTSTARNFRAMLLGYLLELQQVPCEIVLLSEELDPAVEALLADKTLFPNITKVVRVDNYGSSRRDRWKAHRELERIARHAVHTHRPDIVISPSDFLSTFEMYLCRYGKENGACCINICCSINPGKMKDIAQHVLLSTVFRRFPLLSPKISKSIVLASRYLRHFVEYWILPIVNMKRPLAGHSSIILYRGNTGMRDGDHVVTFSTKESSLLEQSGVDTRKIFIVDPPTARDYGRFYREHFSTGLGAANRQILVILDAQNIGFDKNYGLISARRKNESYIDLLEFLAMRFKTSRILIKPHPIIDFLPEVMEMFQRISDRIEFLPKDDAVENYFEQAFLILQPPRAVSTSLNTAAMMYPSKRIVSLDIFEEFLGDYYRDHPTVEYYTRLQDFYESCDKPTVGREAMYLHDGAHASRSDFQRKFRNLVEMISEIC